MGAFNLRNHIIPLVDLSIWLDKQREPSDSPKVIVTEFNNVTTSFLVSGVTRIHRMSWEAVEPPNRYVSKMSGDSITGVVKLEDRIVFLLDLEKIVADLNPNLGLRLDMSIEWHSATRYRALVADDSVLVREMLKDLLQKAGFDVTAVQNGREAWDLLLQIKGKVEAEKRPVTDYVQVMVADIEMPAMDGHNLTKRIKEDGELKALPVILFSSLITDKLRHKGEAVGADDQISKPDVSQLAMKRRGALASRSNLVSSARHRVGSRNASDAFKAEAVLEQFDGFEGFLTIQTMDGEAGVDDDEIADGGCVVDDLQAHLLGDAADFNIGNFIMSEQIREPAQSLPATQTWPGFPLADPPAVSFVPTNAECLRLWDAYGMRAVDYAKTDPNLYFNLGRVYLDWERWDKAERASRLALRLAPTFVEARKLLNFVLKKQGKQPESV